MTSKLIILAAGVGSRLKPLTDTWPKCLLSLGDESLLGRNFRILSSFPKIHITLVTGYLEEKIKTNVLANYPHLNVSFVTNKQYLVTNNAYSLALACGLQAQSFALMDGDLVLKPEIIHELFACGDSNFFWVDQTPSRLSHEAMKIKTDANGAIRLLSKNITLQKAAGEYIGLAHFGNDWAKALTTRLQSLTDAEKKTAYYEDICNWLLENNKELPLLQIKKVKKGSWMEVDTLEDLEEARRRFSS
jgi:choline kinase